MLLVTLAFAAALSAPEPSAADILQRLDMTSFRNSLRPSQTPGKKHPADWQFTGLSTEDRHSYLTSYEEGRRDWVIGLSIIRREPDGVVACFSDQALNGGSYLARSALRIVSDEAGGYRVAEDDLNEPACPPAPGQG